MEKALERHLSGWSGGMICNGYLVPELLVSIPSLERDSTIARLTLWVRSVRRPWYPRTIDKSDGTSGLERVFHEAKVRSSIYSSGFANATFRFAIRLDSGPRAMYRTWDQIDSLPTKLYLRTQKSRDYLMIERNDE